MQLVYLYIVGGIVIPIVCMGLLILTAGIHYIINAITRKWCPPNRWTLLPREITWKYNPFIRTACAL